MLIPEEKISEILNTSDIVDVVSEAVILKKSGRNFFGLCPFHAEKTPSFSVNPEKQIFHCFGCSAGGNAISFVMKYHGLSFPEAARMLARKYNILVETAQIDPARQKKMRIKESLFRVNKKVMDYFCQTLKDPSAGRKVRDYLKQRGTSDEIIDTFHLGWAPDAWDAVVCFFRREKVSRGAAVNSGLILPRKQGSGFYDRFRNRLMFPIFDINMQVAGFGGRVMDDAMPKYLNSPETPVYSKSRILYGLHAAKQECRRQGRVFIVEGYFDVLSLYQHGIKNTVASLGTALTSEHVRILKGYAARMVLVFDSDDAGINAAKRSIQIFVKEGVDTRILVLDKPYDPDSFVMEHGPEAFLELANEAKTAMQFLLGLAMDTHGNSVEGRIKVLDEMKLYLALIQDSALRSLYVRELAETLNIDEKAVLEKVRDAVMRKKTPRTPLIPGPDEGQDIVRELPSDPREKQILSMMLHQPELMEKVREKQVLDAFFSSRLKAVGNRILQTSPETTNFVTAVMAGLDEADQDLVAAMAMEDYSGVEDLAGTAQVLMDRIMKMKLKNDNPLVKRLLEAKKGCDADSMDLLKQKQQEIQRLHNC